MTDAGERLKNAVESAANHPLRDPSMKVADALAPLTSGLLPQEILHTGSDMISIVTDIDGKDYMLNLMEVPRQRERPTSN